MRAQGGVLMLVYYTGEICMTHAGPSYLIRLHFPSQSTVTAPLGQVSARGRRYNGNDDGSQCPLS